MTIIRCLLLVSLNLLFCGGCGDSASDNKPQSWENSRSKSADKTAATEKDKDTAREVGKDSEKVAEKAESPRGAADPHAGMPNPHGGAAPFAGQAAAAPSIENNGKLDVGPAHWTASKAWVRKQPRSDIIMAEYGLPKAEGDSVDGRLTVSMAGGGVAGNIDRWKGQFEKLDKEAKESLDIGGVKVTLVDFSGTYADGGMMGPKTSRPDYRMIGAVYEVGDMLLFVKAYGPAKTMAARVDEVKELVKSYKVDK